MNKRVLERLDAILGDIDEEGRYPTFGKVAIVAVVGHEDGDHHVAAELYQALADVRFTIAGGNTTCWIGETMGSKNCKELKETPKEVSGRGDKGVRRQCSEPCQAA